MLFNENDAFLRKGLVCIQHLNSVSGKLCGGPVDQEEDGEVLADVLNQHPAGRTPISEQDLKHRENGPTESAVVPGCARVSK